MRTASCASALLTLAFLGCGGSAQDSATLTGDPNAPTSATWSVVASLHTRKPDQFNSRTRRFLNLQVYSNGQRCGAALAPCAGLHRLDLWLTVYGDTYAPDGSLESNSPSAPGDFAVTEQQGAGRHRVEGAYYEYSAECVELNTRGGEPGPTPIIAGAVHLAQAASVIGGEAAGSFYMDLQYGRKLEGTFTAAICSDTVDN